MDWILKGIKFFFHISSWDEIKKVLSGEIAIVHKYFGNGVYLIFYLVALFFLIIKRPDLRKVLLLPVSILLFLFAFPKTSHFIMSYMFEGGSIYWRYFWLLQIDLIIAAAVVEMIGIKKKHKGQILLVALGILIVSGSFIFNQNNFQKAENPYKIPEEVVEICDLIKADAGESYLLEDLTVAPAYLAGWIRMYDGDICLLYGRYSSYTYTKNEDTEEINAYLSQKSGSIENVFNKIEKNKCTYLIVENNIEVQEEAAARKYILLGETSHYLLYKISI